MKRFKFTCDDDVAEFIQYLIDTDTVFHLDDDPEDIVWQKKMGTGDIAILKLNMIDLWDYGNPWLVMSKYPKIEQAYMGGEE